MFCLCCKCYCFDAATSNKFKFSSKGLRKSVLEKSGDGPSEKDHCVLDGNVKHTSTSMCFRTNNHLVATHEQFQKTLSNFCHERLVQSDGSHTQHLNFYKY